MMLSNHHRAKLCFFHLVSDTRKIVQNHHTQKKKKKERRALVHPSLDQLV
jgi:hypothetical protein